MSNYNYNRREIERCCEYSYLEIERLQNASDGIVTSCLEDFKLYLQRNGPYDFPLVYYDGAVPIIIGLMRRSAAITRTCVNILQLLLQAPELYYVFYNNGETIQNLIIIFATVNDTTIREYIARMLIKLHENHPAPQVYLMLELVNGVFNTIASEVDPDIINNCLKLFLCMLNTYGSLEFLCECSSMIRIDIIFPLHVCPYGEIRESTFRIFHNLTLKKTLEVKDMWMNFRLMLKYFSLFYIPGMPWDESQNTVVDVINNCLFEKMMYTADLWDDSIKAFIMYVPVDCTPLSFARLTIIDSMTKNHTGLQVLHSYGISTILIQYLKLDCQLCNVIACEIISSYIYFEKCHGLFLTDKVICLIGKIVDRVYVEWNPYKDCIIHILYEFITTTSSNEIIWLQRGGFIPVLQQIITNPDIISKQPFGDILQMYRILFKEKRYQTTVFHSIHIINTLVTCIQSENTRVKRRSFKLLRSCLSLKKCRKWFNDMLGLETLMFIYMTGDNKSKKYVISIFENVFTKPLTAMKFMDRGYLSTIQNETKNLLLSTHLRNSISNAIKLLHEHDYSFKFHEARTLPVENYTDTGFHIYSGYNENETYPLVRNADNFVYDPVYTVICIIFDKRFLETFTSTTESVASTSNNFNSLDVMKQKQKKYIMRSHTRETTVVYTENLDVIVAKLRNIFQTRLSLKEKVEILADIVNRQLSGSSSHKMPKFFDYESHITDLKLLLKSNIIPLSMIRVGLYVERALLFKVLADKLHIPCALHRGAHIYLAWNEVPFPVVDDNGITVLRSYVVDLMHRVGKKYAVGTKNANSYCEGEKMNSKALLYLNTKVQRCSDTAIDKES